VRTRFNGPVCAHEPEAPGPAAAWPRPAVVLIGAGVWMANAILEMRRIQDCAMAGRRNCERITVPGRESWDLPTPSR
jgi:hypothetical protein